MPIGRIVDVISNFRVILIQDKNAEKVLADLHGNWQRLNFLISFFFIFGEHFIDKTLAETGIVILKFV